MPPFPIMRPYITFDPPFAAIDYRSNPLSPEPPTIHNNRVFDSFEHQLVHDHRYSSLPLPLAWLKLCKHLLTKEELSLLSSLKNHNEAQARRRLISSLQPDTTGC